MPELLNSVRIKVQYVLLRSPRLETWSVLMLLAAQEQVPVCLFSLQMKQRYKPAVIVIPVTAAHKQPSPKMPPPHNEMWSIISRVGTRQFQNLPSDVFFFVCVCVYLSVFHHDFVLSIFPHHLPVSPSLCAKHWGRPSALQELRDQWDALSSDYFSLTGRKEYQNPRRAFFCLSSSGKIWCCCCYALPRLRWADRILSDRQWTLRDRSSLLLE